MDPVRHLGAALTAIGYADGAVAERLGLDANMVIRADDLPVHLRRLHGGDGIDTLIRLFFLLAPVMVEEAEAVLAPVGLKGLEEAGLVRGDGPLVRALVRLTPYSGLVIASDPHLPGDLREDSVLGLTSSARTLASMTVRDRVASALDLGTGSGVQALLAARHAERVVAVDLNLRALWLTEVNCHLNGISNIDCRQGDLFDPVRDEVFDLVVTNPPFVISPSRHYLFRDSAREDDGLSRAAVVGAAAVLAEGGYAHVMCNWIVGRDKPWSAPVESWVEGSGCDVLILHYETVDPLRYAAVWNDDIVSDTARFGAALDAWLAHYRERGIEAIGMGAVVLRRRTADDNWIRTAEQTRGPSGSAGDQVRRLFTAHDVSPAAGDKAALLDRSFALVDGHGLHQVLRFRDAAYTAEDAVIVLDDGLGLRNRVPPQALHVLLRMDGSRPLRDLVLETAEETGLDVEALAARTVECVGELFELGFLEPAPTDHR
ncbi:MAG: class I SAM-dependent methyltransferase [Actinomycetota bacterium]|nr:class I SAM-dependent methyltransferase [Actinomycetota bacterium]